MIKVSYRIKDGYVESWGFIVDGKPAQFENEYVFFGSGKKELNFAFRHFNDNYYDYKQVETGLEYDATHNGKQKLVEKKKARRELESLYEWFAWYDQQVIQYGRAVRMGQAWTASKDGVTYAAIEELDAKAVLVSERINKLIGEQ